MPILGKIYVWGERAKHVPDEPGVYALYDEKNVLIYMGKSVSLREQFAHYLKTEFSDEPCKRETRYYAREFASGHEERLKALLEEYRREHGKLPKCNLDSDSHKEEVGNESEFHFYEGIGKLLRETASTLEEFREKVAEIPVTSLEFHQQRGDFARWIRDIFEDALLAEAIVKIDETGEDLRKELLRSLRGPEKGECPRCGIETDPIKTWKMAGRPSAAGERLQLTIGHYKCLKCEKTFRRVIAKEKISAT